jgi:hypothetical protein
MVNHGSFDILITPDHCGECLISTDQLNSTGHVVTMTTTETIIADVLYRYTLRYPREPGNRDYPVPLDVLHRISELRKQYPMTEPAQAAMREPYKIPTIEIPRQQISQYSAERRSSHSTAIPHSQRTTEDHTAHCPSLSPSTAQTHGTCTRRCHVHGRRA